QELTRRERLTQRRKGVFSDVRKLGPAALGDRGHLDIAAGAQGEARLPAEERVERPRQPRRDPVVGLIRRRREGDPLAQVVVMKPRARPGLTFRKYDPSDGHETLAVPAPSPRRDERVPVARWRRVVR